MKTQVVVLHAERKPLEGVVNPGPHQIYRHPRLSVEARELPEVVPQDEIRVQMVYAGICGTDVHLSQAHPKTGYIRSSAPALIPPEGRIIGHEGVGKILAIGANVCHLQPGMYVTFESIITCHACDICRRGRFNQCRHARLSGSEKDGLFGTVVDLPAMLAHDVTDLAEADAGVRAAACVEPAGVAYVACQNSNIHGGDVVVIFGAGPIGLFTALLSKTVFGASEVYVVEPVPFRRKFAAMWADAVYDVEEFFTRGPQDVDVVIEASGDLRNVTRISRRVDANGRIALLARSGEPLTLDAVDHIITNEISLIGSRGHLCGAFMDILRLYRKRRIPLEKIVTNVVRGPEAICKLLTNPETIIQENCKTLARFPDGGGGE